MPLFTKADYPTPEHYQLVKKLLGAAKRAADGLKGQQCLAVTEEQLQRALLFQLTTLEVEYVQQPAWTILYHDTGDLEVIKSDLILKHSADVGLIVELKHAEGITHEHKLQAAAYSSKLCLPAAVLNWDAELNVTWNPVYFAVYGKEKRPDWAPAF